MSRKNDGETLTYIGEPPRTLGYGAMLTYDPGKTRVKLPKGSTEYLSSDGQNLLLCASSDTDFGSCGALDHFRVDNSKEALLQRLREGTVMNGWGAIMALGRKPLDELLMAHFLERFARSEFFAPISGRYFSDGQRNNEVVFDGLEFGAPRLSFAGVSGGSARVTVILPFIAGEYYVYSQLVGQSPCLKSSHGLREELGYHLRMSVDLEVVQDDLLNQSQLLLDLSKADKFTSNLGENETAQQAMGNFIATHIKNSEVFTHRFVLLRAELGGMDAISLRGLAVRTMSAPTGADEDGAAVIMLDLRGRRYGGVWPSPGQFPYLLPDGSAGVTLLVEKLRVPLLDKSNRRLLARLSMPGSLSFYMPEQHDPLDKVMFGAVVASGATGHVEPGMARLVPGQALDFKLAGQPVSGWVARNIRHPRSAGSIDGKGLYQGSSLTHFARETQVVLVSAQLPDADSGVAPSALVVESTSGMAISPRVHVWRPAEPAVELLASGQGNCKWSLVPVADGASAQGEPMNHGQLEDLGGGRARFTPHAPGPLPQVLVQRIRATDDFTGQHGEATVVILAYGATLNVLPFHSGRVPRSRVQFEVEGYKDATWQLFGEGTLDPKTGVYEVPPSPALPVAVVMAVINNRYAGYGIIELMRENARAAMYSERYQSLKHFTLTKVPANAGSLYANGLQQFAVDIMIETNDFKNSDGDTVSDRVSDLELSTLKILGSNGQPIEYILDGAEGLAPDLSARPVYRWGWSRSRNRYDYLWSGKGAEQVRRADDERTVNLRLWLHTTEAETRKFHAAFTGPNNTAYVSIDVSGEDQGQVELTGLAPPGANTKSFEVTNQTRVANTGGKTVGSDSFNYYRYTTDYWELTGKTEAYGRLSFYGVKPSHCSMIWYESEQLDETFCSYTGLAMKPGSRLGKADDEISIEYDAALQLLTLEPLINYHHNLEYLFSRTQSLAPGQVKFSLDRVSDIPFWFDGKGGPGSDYRQTLDMPMTLTLTDQYGNTHRVRVGFGSGDLDSRNRLTVQDS